MLFKANNLLTMTKRINIHTHQQSTLEEDIEIISVFHHSSIPEDIKFSIGIHPWHAEKNSASALIDELFPKARFAFAIGECGLDRSSSINWEKQVEVFRKQIDLSERFNKPMIIHAVRSYPDIIALHKIYKPFQAWIIHGFQGDVKAMEQLIQHEGIYISFGANILRENPKHIEALKNTPIDRLFLETDESSISLKKIYNYVSNCLNIPEEKLIEKIHNNFLQLIK